MTTRIEIEQLSGLRQKTMIKNPQIPEGASDTPQNQKNRPNPDISIKKLNRG